MATCPCYTVATSAFVSSYSSNNCGICETKIDCQFDDGNLIADYMQTIIVNPDGREAINEIKNYFYQVISNMKSPIYNCQKTAIAIVFNRLYSVQRALNLAPESSNFGLLDYVICWIKNSKAVDGPCAATLISICKVFSTVESIEFFYEAQAQIIAAHACCDFKPLILPSQNK